MTETQPAQYKSALSLWILALLLTVTTYCSHVDAFVLTSPTNGLAQTTRARPLFVVADPPGREEKKKKQNKDDNNDDDDWIATSNGGFLPRLPRAFLKETVKPVAVPPITSPVPRQIVTIQGYKAAVADERDQMVCVRFYAPWCKACKAVQQPFRKLCRDHPGVKFVEVPLTRENAFLHDGLGVPSLPYGHIYHPQVGLVEERKMKKGAEFAEFERVLENYVQGECQVEYPEDDASVCRPKK